MIENLIKEGKYEEALSLLKDKNDEKSIYSRATCLYYLERYDELISFCDLYLENAGSHYYDLLLIEVDCLTKLNNIDKALDLLKEELRMPWIPMEYEDKIQSSYDALLKVKNLKEVNESPLNRLSDDDLYALLDKKSEYLLDKEVNKDFDINLSVECLNVMSKRNIRNFINNIQLFLENQNKVNDLKVILIELLKDQHVDHMFKYVNGRGVYFINPINSPDLFKNADLDAIINIVLDTFNLKDMSLLEYIKRLLVAYLVMVYPEPILKDEHRYIAGALYAVAHKDNNIELDLNEISEKLSLNGNLFNKYYQKVLNVEIY